MIDASHRNTDREGLMATPTMITISGKLEIQVGVPDSSATVTFKRREFVRHEDGTVIEPGSQVVVVDPDGTFEVVVMATDDPEWVPLGWTYRVAVSTGEDVWVFFAAVPHDSSAGTLTFGELLPAQDSAAGILYASLGHTHSGYVTEAEVDSLVQAAIEALEIDPETLGLHAVASSGAYADLEGLPNLTAYATDIELADAVDDLELFAQAGDAAVAYTAALAYDQSVAAQAAVAAKADKDLSDDFIIIRKTDNSSSLRLRSTGGAVDFDFHGDIVVGHWENGDFTGTQVAVMRWKASGITLAGKTEFGSGVYAGENYVDPAVGRSELGGRGDLVPIRVVGQHGSAGAPAGGDWDPRDAFLDIDGHWHIRNTGDTAWVSATALFAGVLVLEEGDPIPGGTPPGTVIIRTAP